MREKAGFSEEPRFCKAIDKLDAWQLNSHFNHWPALKGQLNSGRSPRSSFMVSHLLRSSCRVFLS